MFEPLIPEIDLSEIRFEHDWRVHLRRAKLKILFVTDSRFNDTDSVYEFMDGQTLGCTNFEVHRALYTNAPGGVTVDPSPGPNDPHYTGFQFQSEHPDGGKILDRYHVVFLFAVSSSSSFIDDAECAELHRWMDAGGGIFATGDHATLGQRMASRIPRVGTMRKWTTADGVPPRLGPTRLDTNQPDPGKPGEVAGTEEIPTSAQSDEHPQPITWLAVRTRWLSAYRQVRYPHEILCHPDHGAINVMPDHPHEGECADPSTINYAAPVKYDESDDAPKEYPTTSGGHQEKPVIIARGRNASQYWQAKDDPPGNLDDKVFDMISVYDGHENDVGRVVVDSTWHHWYGMNINGLIAAGGVDWDKIGRYFLNVAKYLAPAGVYRESCWWEVLDRQFQYPFNEEVLLVEHDLELRELGNIYREGLRLSWGECGVTRFVLENICVVRPGLCELIEREVIPPIDPQRPPHGPVCLTCPPWDLIQATVLGGIVRGTQPLREQLTGIFFEGKQAKGRIEPDVIRKHALEGVAEALDEMVEEIQSDLEHTTKAWSATGDNDYRQKS